MQQQQLQPTRRGLSIIIFHGTSSNRASKIVGNQFYEKQGFKRVPAFFAEDFTTAIYFAFEKATAPVPHSPQRLTVIEFTITEELATEIGLGANNRKPIGELYGMRFPDIPGGSGYERIIINNSDLGKFNEALKLGAIATRRLRVR